jgi:hypothetical protein
MDVQPQPPLNTRAVLSFLLAVLTVISFCIGVAPIPLTALVCYPAAILLGLASLWMGSTACGKSARRAGADAAWPWSACGAGDWLCWRCWFLLSSRPYCSLISSTTCARFGSSYGFLNPTLSLPCASTLHRVSLRAGVVRSRWVSWSSKPVAGRVAGRGGFDSHPLPPMFERWTINIVKFIVRILLLHKVSHGLP